MRELTTEGESMRRYREEEKEEILKEVESLRNVSLVAKKHGMLVTTIQNWINLKLFKVKPERRALLLTTF